MEIPSQDPDNPSHSGNRIEYSATTTSPAIDNQIHHIVGTCDLTAKEVKIYMDGVLEGTAAIPEGNGTTLSLISTFYFGNYQSGLYN